MVVEIAIHRIAEMRVEAYASARIWQLERGLTAVEQQCSSLRR